MKKRCGSCFEFAKTFKTESRSNGGNTIEKLQKKNFCGRFHAEVNPSGKPCRHWNGAAEEVGDE